TLGTIQLGKYCSPGNRQSQTRPSDYQTEKRDSSLQRTCFHCSRVQWQLALLGDSCCCSHFVIKPLTVDRGIFSSKEISEMDLLHRWQPITVH
ncbi:unnamed protein product, partial [Staurois parvus]